MLRSVALALALFSICRLCAAQDTMSGVVDFRFATVKHIDDAFSVAVMVPTGKTKTEEKEYTVMVPYTENGRVKYLAERRSRRFSVPILETKLIKLGPESKFEDLRGRPIGQATLLNSTKKANRVIVLKSSGKMSDVLKQFLHPDVIVLRSDIPELYLARPLP